MIIQGYDILIIGIPSHGFPILCERKNMCLKESTTATKALYLAKQCMFREQINPKRQNILHG